MKVLDFVSNKIDEKHEPEVTKKRKTILFRKLSLSSLKKKVKKLKKRHSETTVSTYVDLSSALTNSFISSLDDTYDEADDAFKSVLEFELKLDADDDNDEDTKKCDRSTECEYKSLDLKEKDNKKIKKRKSFNRKGFLMFFRKKKNQDHEYFLLNLKQKESAVESEVFYEENKDNNIVHVTVAASEKKSLYSDNGTSVGTESETDSLVYSEDDDGDVLYCDEFGDGLFECLALSSGSFTSILNMLDEADFEEVKKKEKREINTRPPLYAVR